MAHFFKKNNALKYLQVWAQVSNLQSYDLNMK